MQDSASGLHRLDEMQGMLRMSRLTIVSCSFSCGVCQAPACLDIESKLSLQKDALWIVAVFMQHGAPAKAIETAPVITP